MPRELKLDRLPKRVLAALDLETVFKASRCVLAAEQLQVFRKLDGKELSAADVGKRTGIKRAHCEPFLEYLVYLGLLRRRNGLYRNSALATRHFIDERSADWSRFWSDECRRDFEALTVLEESITTGKSWRELLAKERLPDYELVLKDRQWARDFTYALYDVDKPVAKILAKNLDLSHYRSLLDVGGGSGVVSFALVRAFPKLKTCVLELEYVADAAREIIRKEGLSRRVKAMAGDMNKDIPEGFDAIMFWNIGKIDERVWKMAFDRLPEGGIVITSCSTGSNTKIPSSSAFMHRYLGVRPAWQSRAGILDAVRRAGFKTVRYRKIGPGTGLITGFKGRTRKPE